MSPITLTQTALMIVGSLFGDQHYPLPPDWNESQGHSPKRVAELKNFYGLFKVVEIRLNGGHHHPSGICSLCPSFVLGQVINPKVDVQDRVPPLPREKLTRFLLVDVSHHHPARCKLHCLLRRTHRANHMLSEYLDILVGGIP